MSARPPRLLFGIGNPSRGDDALGYLFIEEAHIRFADLIECGELEVMTDFQLQIEHALDLEGRDHVLFIDASVDTAAPFTLTPVTCVAPAPLSHAMSPAALLGVVADLGQRPPKRVEVLAIRGESFELGAPLSALARIHLDEALHRVQDLVNPTSTGVSLTITGIVQGVGFRPFIARTARALGLTGSVRNSPAGVVVELWGDVSALTRFKTALQSPPPGATLRSIATTPIATPAPPTFEILPSTPGPARLSIPPDLALCADCRREIDDSTIADRHFDHPFTSCTSCGPRLSIATGLPYDRHHTTMATFGMCHECANEYATEDNRRYHAQAIACPECGPTLTLVSNDPDTATLGPRHQPSGVLPLDTCADLVRGGAIVAIQGLGGFHLACDATSSDAVARLRARKHRDGKPFAVMVEDISMALILAHLTSETSSFLSSSIGPIVIAPARSDTPLAAEVTNHSPSVGLLLPTTPLHARLLARVGIPLVMTSGNLSGEPVAITHEEAFAALGHIVDAFLVHDRPIARRVEDSVVVHDPLLPPRVIRRARGYAPSPIRLPVSSPDPILAVGGHMKNTAAVVIGDECWLTPHLGDLDSYPAERAWIRDVENFEKLLGVRCELLVHDQHPDYTTTRYAERRGPRPESRADGRPRHGTLALQHHHAHVLAVLAENRTLEPVVALAFDGTGWGPDGTAWGGEFLRVDGLSMRRPTALRPIPLPGGERAIHEVWRTAYGALFDTFGPETPALVSRLEAFHTVAPSTLDSIQQALTCSVGVVAARGLGRVFDAAASLLLARPDTSFEGELPMRLTDLATDFAHPYPFEVPSTVGTTLSLTPDQELDLRPMWRALVSDLLSHTSATTIASRLHATVVAATMATLEGHQLAAGVRHIVLTGGAFQNRVLQRMFRHTLGSAILDPHEVPVHDGGLALGQALAGALFFSGAR